MHIPGVILAIFGTVFIFTSALALSSLYAKPGHEMSASEIFDIFILGGLITFVRDLFRAISDGIKNRSSTAFPLVIILGCGIAMFAIGVLLI